MSHFLRCMEITEPVFFSANNNGQKVTLKPKKREHFVANSIYLFKGKIRFS